MKLRIEKEVSIASAFTHLIAAWDVGPYSWFESVKYTDAGRKALDGIEPSLDAALATVIMDHPDDEEAAMHSVISGRWLAVTLQDCLKLGGAPARAAMQIINEDPAADQNTADLVMQVGAYGSVVFG